MITRFFLAIWAFVKKLDFLLIFVNSLFCHINIWLRSFISVFSVFLQKHTGLFLVDFVFIFFILFTILSLILIVGSMPVLVSDPTLLDITWPTEVSAPVSDPLLGQQVHTVSESSPVLPAVEEQPVVANSSSKSFLHYVGLLFAASAAAVGAQEFNNYFEINNPVYALSITTSTIILVVRYFW